MATTGFTRPNITNDDWIAIAATVVVHLLLLWILSFAVREPAQMQTGFIEVDFGEFQDGRPVQANEALEEIDDQSDEESEEVEEQSAQEEAAAAQPVDLPDEQLVTQDPESVTDPEENPTDAASDPTDARQETIPREESQASRASASDADTDRSNNTGDDGDGSSEEKTAPYQLIGLDRDVRRSVMPNYAEQVNAIVSVRITVNPKGRVIRVIPVRKGNPALDNAVQQAVRRWQFDPLPRNVPQENQIGELRFRFRLQ